MDEVIKERKDDYVAENNNNKNILDPNLWSFF